MSDDQSPEYQLGSAVYKAFKESGTFKLVLHVGDEKFTVVDNDAFQDGIIKQFKGSDSGLMKTDEWKEVPAELRCKILEQLVSNLSLGGQPNRMGPIPVSRPMPQPMPQSMSQSMSRPIQATCGTNQINPELDQQSAVLSAFQRAIVLALRSGFPEAINQKTLVDPEDSSTVLRVSRVGNDRDSIKSIQSSESTVLRVSRVNIDRDSIKSIQGSEPTSRFKAFSLPSSVWEIDFPQESRSPSVSSKSDDKENEFCVEIETPEEIKEHDLIELLGGKKMYKCRITLRNVTPNMFVFRVLPSTNDFVFSCDPPEIKVSAFGKDTMKAQFSKSDVIMAYEEMYQCGSDELKTKSNCNFMNVNL